MPQIKGDPHRMDCGGVDLVHAIDKMPPGAFPYLMNARVVQEGRIDARPGYSLWLTMNGGPNLLHSMRVMNDVDLVYNAGGSIQFFGNGTNLYAGPSLLDTGYSGFPLSLLTFRPESSSTAWMYVYDENKQVKVRSDGVLRSIGLPPPGSQPDVTYGPPAFALINEPVIGRGWVQNGNVASPSLSDRTSSSTPTIGSILYDDPVAGVGWCCINPVVASSSFFWAGQRMLVNINGEQVVVREIHQAIAATSVQSIRYVKGTTGMCTIVLAGSPSNLERNSLINLAGHGGTPVAETVRVLAVTFSPDGSTYSLRCKLTGNHIIGEAVTGVYSWYVWTAVPHVATDAISVSYESSSASQASGTVNTNGTTVNWASGQVFNLTWPVGSSPGAPGATTIKIGVTTWTIAAVVSTTQLVVNAVIAAGVTITPGIQTGAAYSVTTPSLSGSLDLLYAVTGGTVSTVGTAVSWVSGPKFTDWPTGTKIIINAVTYKIAFVVSDIALVLTSTAGTQTAQAYSIAGVDAQTTGAGSGRPITIADDYIHFSIFLQSPQYVADVVFAIDIDPATSTVGPGGNAFTGNFWTWTVPGAQLSPNVSGNTVGNSWIEIVVPISSGVRSGNNLALNFSLITALRVQVLTTQTTGFGFDNWYFFGTFGPNIAINSPTGLLYEAVNRDSTTGVTSLPGPQTDYQLFPLHEEILVKPPFSYIAGVDSLDLYRQGGLLGNFAYIGTAINQLPVNTFHDIATDTIVAANPAPDLTLIQPWPILQLPWSGLVDTVGTIAVWKSGTRFDANLLAASVINISGVAYLTRGQPHETVAANSIVDANASLVAWVSGDKFSLTWDTDTTIILDGTPFQVASVQSDIALTLGSSIGGLHSSISAIVEYTAWVELTSSAGTQALVPYQINSPTLAGQSLPFAFGPLEGPVAPVVFALGDLVNAGTLYYSNPSNADAASDKNTLELCTPSEPLISGDVWNGLAFAGSHDNLYTVRYSYLTTIGVESGGPTVFQWSRIPAASGIWSRWACTRGPDGVYYLGRDGIYKVTDQGAVNITDDLLYPLFPHDGQSAAGANGLLPVDMARYTELRLVRGDESMLFFYRDILGASLCLRYEYARKRWFPHQYGVDMGTAYLIEKSETQPTAEQLFYLSRTRGIVYLAGGDTDDGVPLTTTVQTPSFDGGDERLQKLYVDALHDFDQPGEITVGLGMNDNTVPLATVQIFSSSTRSQLIQNVSSLTRLALWRNIAVRYTWTGGPSGPRVYSFNPYAYAQPYVSTSIVTQYINLGYPGWKHHRRLYPGLISTGPLTFTIKTQDGRTYSTVIPSTEGQFRIFPIMLPQNVKDLAFAYQLTGGTFALFPEAFTIETKEWQQPQYVQLPIFAT